MREAQDGSVPGALRSARAARGWSQSRAARELRELASRRGGPEASAASLKTQLSRWENGHALPEPAYRALLAELYDRPAEELGLLPRAPAPGADDVARLRSELAAARAAGPAVLEQWRAQLASARRLDDELGAAGAGEVAAALVTQLRRTLLHTPGADRRPALAALLAAAAGLAGRHALDRAEVSVAWAHFTLARTAAAEAGSAAGVVAAAAGQAEVLRVAGEAAAAAELLAEVPPATGDAAARLAAARGVAWAALGQGSAVPGAFAEARAELGRVDAAHPLPEFPVELADVQRWHGHALAALHDPAATDALQHALEAPPRSARDRAALHADLAVALAERGRADAAGHHARQAQHLAERIGAPAITAAFRSPAHGRRAALSAPAPTTGPSRDPRREGS